MTTPSQPVYRLQRGRLPKDREIRGNAATRLVHTQFPLDLFELIYNDCLEDDVADALSALRPAYVSDYVRAACLVFHLLLESPTRDRVLALANLPEQYLPSVLSRLAFLWAALPADNVGYGTPGMTPEGVDSAAHADLYQQNEGVAPLPASEAPLDDPTPWHQPL